LAASEGLKLFQKTYPDAPVQVPTEIAFRACSSPTTSLSRLRKPCSEKAQLKKKWVRIVINQLGSIKKKSNEKYIR
jgi:hypothetical protein